MRSPKPPLRSRKKRRTFQSWNLNLTMSRPNKPVHSVSEALDSFFVLLDVKIHITFFSFSAICVTIPLFQRFVFCFCFINFPILLPPPPSLPSISLRATIFQHNSN